MILHLPRTACGRFVLIASAAAAIGSTVYLAVYLSRRYAANPAPQNLLHLSPAERRAFLASFDVIATDCDGTVWDLVHGKIAGAGAGLAALRALGKRVLFVTNNSVRTDAEYLESFRADNITATMADVLHPPSVCVETLRARRFDGLVYAIGMGNFRMYLERAGVRLVPQETREQLQTFTDLFKYAQDGLQVDLVILDWDNNLEYKQLLRAHAYLLANPACELWIGVSDAYFPITSGQPMPAIAGLIALMEQWTERKAYTVGKPGSALREVLLRKCEIAEPSRVLFVGDA